MPDLTELSDEELLQQYRQARQSTSGLDEAAGTSGVGFFDRLAAGFGINPEQERSILEQRGFETGTLSGGQPGVVTTRPSGKRVLSAVDVEGVPELGDLADIAGEIPSGLLSVLAGIGGAATPIPGAGPAMAAAGSGIGDLLRQKIGGALGSGQDVDPLHIGVEAGLGLGGELLGGPASKAVAGPFRKSTTGDQVRRVMDDVGAFDTRFGTNIEGRAPVDVQSGSDALAAMTQRVRESEFGGQALREGQDQPFQRELSEGFEALRRESGAAGPPSTPGPYGQPVGARQAGADLRQAAVDTRQARTAESGRNYEAFRETIDPQSTPDLTNTQQVIQEIRGTDILQRGKTGAGGLEDLRTALEEAENIQTFDDLVRHRKAVADEIGSFDPTRMSRGSEGLFKKLRGALQADEDAFMEAGEGVIPFGATGQEAVEAGTKARTFARDLFGIDEASTGRMFRDELKQSDIVARLPRMNADEIKAVRQFVGAEGTQGGVTATQQGREAWEGVAAEILDDLKKAGRDPAKSTRDEFYFSGTRLETELGKYKEGALEEIFGAETAADLRQFSDILKGTSVSERGFANRSLTGQSEQSSFNELAGFFLSPRATAAKIAGRAISGKLGGRLFGSQGGKDFLLGQLPFQQSPGLIGALGRAGGQVGVRNTADRFGVR